MASERTQLLASGNSYRRPSLRGNGQMDSSEDYQGEIIKDEVSLCCSYRLGVIICCTFAMTITFAVQASMSSAMVCMLEDPIEDIPLTNGSNWTLLEYNHTDINQTGQEWKFPWDKTSQGWALSSFFVGYYVSQLPSGIASARFGAKKVVVLGLTLTAVFQLLTVPAAYYGLGWLYADRIIVGFIDGFLYAPTFALVGQWTPRHETSLLFGLVGMGMELGDMVSFGISLFACELPIQGGWPFVFYTMSAIGLVLAIFFVLFVSDSPFDNRLMSEAEVSFIASSIPKVEEKSARALAKIPVKEILKSMPVWAIVVSQIGSDWMYYCILTVSPTYLKEIIKLSNLEINLLSGVPFLFIIPTIYLSGYISDKVVMKGMLSNTSVRKINDAFCKLIPAGVVIALGFLPEGYTAVAFVLNVIGDTALGFAYVAWMANPVDLAPAYTGFIVGICEVGAVWVAIVVPILVDTITADKSREKWQLAFYITAGIQVFCYIFYIIFASGELQPWAFSTYSKVGYDDLDKGDKDSKLKTHEGSESSIDSLYKEKRRAEEEEKQRLITSLSLSLGGFRGTSSYEREMAEEQRRRAHYNSDMSSAVTYFGPAQADTKLESGYTETTFEDIGPKNNGVSIGVQVSFDDRTGLTSSTEEGSFEQSYLLKKSRRKGQGEVSRHQPSEDKLLSVAVGVASSAFVDMKPQQHLMNAEHTSSIMAETISDPETLRHKEPVAVNNLSLWEEIHQAEGTSSHATDPVPIKKRRSFMSRLFKLGRSASNPDLEAKDNAGCDEIDGAAVTVLDGENWTTKSFDSGKKKTKGDKHFS
ncbi:sialin-like [Biomphalaria glabrata]|uniref:Sialin-like n=2 Tax=Biomphalaria glabrata TaxID=6526 RepID=A0A9W2YQG0_BIOGL|nr:sialin-like [Biomphalaria glabrata]